MEEDGWDGVFFMDSQNLSMGVFGSLYLAASATSRLELGTAVTNLVRSHPAVMASSFATLHHVFGSGPHVLDVGARLGDRLIAAVGAEPERIAWAVGTAREARRARA